MNDSAGGEVHLGGVPLLPVPIRKVLNQTWRQKPVLQYFFLTQQSKSLLHSALLSAWRSSFMSQAYHTPLSAKSGSLTDAYTPGQRGTESTVPGFKDIQLLEVYLNVEKSLLFNSQREFWNLFTLSWKQVRVWEENSGVRVEQMNKQQENIKKNVRWCYVAIFQSMSWVSARLMTILQSISTYIESVI